MELDSIIKYRLHVEIMGRQWKLAPLSDRAKRNMAYAKFTLTDKPGDLFSTPTDNKSENYKKYLKISCMNKIYYHHLKIINSVIPIKSI